MMVTAPQTSCPVKRTPMLASYTALSALIVAGLSMSTPVFAASQDGLSPQPASPSLLDPQKKDDQNGVVSRPATPLKAAPTGNTQRVRIKSIQFTGNTLFGNDELLAVLRDPNSAALPLGMLTFDQIQALADKLTAFYRKSGYLVSQAVLPEQDVSSGRLTIRLIEGRLDAVRVETKPDINAPLVKEAFEQNYASNSGAVRTDDLNRSLRVAGEATGTSLKGNMQASSKPGGSELVLNPTRLPLFFYGFNADNFGSKTLGKDRGTVFVGGNSWLMDGDRTRFEFGATNEFDRSRHYDLAYAAPVGLTGWSAGVRTWYTEYNLGGVFANAQVNGTAQAGELTLNYALQRNEDARSDIRSGYTYVALTDKVLSTSNNQRHTNTVWTTLTGYFDDSALSTKARNIYSGTVTVGDLAFDDAAANASDKSGLKTNGTYALVSFSDSREQLLVDSWSLYGLARGQTASKNLDSYHKMSLGGPSAVRAYASGEAAGDRAVIGTAELRYLYPFELFGKASSARLAGFYDLGWSQINTSPLSSTSSSANTATRGGYGMELNVFWDDQIGVQLFWAHTSDNKRVSDADGKRSRYGLSVAGSF